MSDGDEDLVTRTAAGDATAFRELLERYELKLYRLALRIVHNDHDAQEIVQGVFLSTWRSLSGTGWELALPYNRECVAHVSARAPTSP
jgi:RNA polymerase sigma-70 factor (ECF subfamily)